MPNTTNFNWPTPADTDLVKDGAAAIRNLGNGIDTSLIDLKGGTTGQILSKASNADMDFTFITPNVGDITEVQAGVGISVASGTGPIPIITNSSTDLITTAGDLLYGTAADTVARLGIGTAGQVLKVNSTATAPEWGAAGGGSVTFAGCLAYRVTTATIAGSTNTAITLTAEQYDTDGYHDNSTNTSRLTIPSGKAGYYQIVANITTATTTSANSIAIYINGNRYVSNDFTGNSGNEGKNISIIAYLAVSDYVEMKYSNGSASALTVYGSTDTGDQSTSLAIGFLGA